MIIKIKTFSPSNVCNLTIDGDKNLIEFNGMELEKNVEFEIKKFINIFSSWNEDYSNPLIFDQENFSVMVCDGTKSKTINGFGNYPKNYNEFKKLIEEIKKCF